MEKFIPGLALYDLWIIYSTSQKLALARKIVNIVLVHEDFYSRNILITSEGDTATVLDEEFASLYRLSEAITSIFVHVVEPTTDKIDGENTIWG
jgi:hypothetical protein